MLNEILENLSKKIEFFAEKQNLAETREGFAYFEHKLFFLKGIFEALEPWEDEDVDANN
jgi:hypothetical protein